MKLRDTLFKFGTEFQAERSRTITNPKKPSIPPGNTLAKWISREIPKIFEEIFQKELDGFQVHASELVFNFLRSFLTLVTYSY